MKMSEFCQVTDGAAISPYDDFIIQNIVTDSRVVKKDDVFLALKGEQFDGHDFCKAAVDSGAKAIIVDKLELPLPEKVLVVKVKSTLKAYQDIAEYKRLKFDIPVIAVTGSTGKTSTKDIIAAALSSSMKVLKSHANFNNEIGLPATLLNLDSTYESAVVEMGMRGKGQIKELAEIAHPTIGVVTNVGKTHIELLKSVQNIMKAKRELVEALDQTGTVILNADDENVRSMSGSAKGKVVLFGFSDDADIKASDVVQSTEGLTFTCTDKQGGRKFAVKLPLLGRHNIYNALCAIAVCSVLQVDTDRMLEGLSKVELSAMRQQVSKISGMIFIDDTYNASPDSMKAALELLQDMPGKRKIAILGDMLELGKVSDDEHTRLGDIAAESGVELLVTIGSKTYHTSERAAEKGVRTWHFKTHSQAVEMAGELLEKGDTVLFKGSRGMHIEEVLKALTEKLRDKK